MPRYFIHAINSEFHARDDGDEYARPEDAMSMGIQSAAALIADELRKGIISAAIEVRVEQEDGASILRSVVCMSVAPLLLSA